MMPEELRTEKIIIKRELKADVSKCDDLVAVLDRCKLDVFEAQKPGSALQPASPRRVLSIAPSSVGSCPAAPQGHWALLTISLPRKAFL